MRRAATGKHRICVVLAAVCALAWPVSAPAIDLRRAAVERLGNGLTVIVLEDRSFPIVSTQMIYRSGSRDDAAGKAGLSHFLEHMAFRASENFPGTGLVSQIYAAGGEWHGYTWLDQTSFYATMPRDGLDLLLRIEADRMARLSLDPGAVEAEAGAVVAEMKGYENDPTTVLFDDVVATAIKLHPYRNNTIGYEADVRTLTHADVVDHYRRNYRASNAVLAIAGDVERSDALAAVRRHFAQLPKLDPPRRTPAVEPPQTGERRTRLTGPVTRSYFKAAYPAPAASGADFAAFLVLQELVGGGSGVNFRQNDWGTPARAGSALYGATGDISTWFIPTAEPYVFMISGSVDAGASERGVEQTIEARLRQLRDRLPTREALATARRAVARQLVFDVETTEDAAHQLAFFEGIGALEQLMTLNGQVALVSAADVNRAARRYLDPVLRTLGWFTPGKAPDDRTGSRPEPRRIGAGPGAASPQERASPPTVRRLSGGLPVVFQRSPLSDSATLGLVFVGQLAGASPDQPVAGYSLLTRRVLAREFDGGAADLLAALAAAATRVRAGSSDDPAAVFDQVTADALGLDAPSPRPVPAFIVAAGNLDETTAIASLERSFGSISPGRPVRVALAALPPGRMGAAVAGPKAQARIGYLVKAPPPQSQQALAWHILRYILTHGYEGRLGLKAINGSGLVYRIDSTYGSTGAEGWISLSSGVDPAKIDAMEAMVEAELHRLETEPPSDDEIAEAKRHILGRARSATQSNGEIVELLAAEFAELGALRTDADLVRAFAAVDRRAVLAAIPAFTAGRIVRVDVGTRGRR